MSTGTVWRIRGAAGQRGEHRERAGSPSPTVGGAHIAESAPGHLGVTSGSGPEGVNKTRLQKFYWSPPEKRRLLWALPLGVLICAAWWWFENGLWNYGGYSRASKAEIAAFDSSFVYNYTVSPVIGSIPTLVANWSRTLWPRLAVTVALVAVQLITGTIFVLIPRAE